VGLLSAGELGPLAICGPAGPMPVVIATDEGDRVLRERLLLAYLRGIFTLGFGCCQYIEILL
jgi:hypothetical protein